MSERFNGRRRQLMLAGAALTAGSLPLMARAADAVKVGLIVPMSGPFASTGRQIEAAVKLYQQKFGDSAGGRKVEILFKDDGGVSPDVTKRLAHWLRRRSRPRPRCRRSSRRRRPRSSRSVLPISCAPGSRWRR